MTDSEGEQVVTCQVTGMYETEAGIPLTIKWYIYWVVCCITKETNNMYTIKFRSFMELRSVGHFHLT
jgi:hypothetical protein